MPTYLPARRPRYLHAYIPTHLHTYYTHYLSICLSVYLIYLYMHRQCSTQCKLALNTTTPVDTSRQDTPCAMFDSLDVHQDMPLHPVETANGTKPSR